MTLVSVENSTLNLATHLNLSGRLDDDPFDDAKGRANKWLGWSLKARVSFDSVSCGLLLLGADDVRACSCGHSHLLELATGRSLTNQLSLAAGREAADEQVRLMRSLIA